MFPQHLKNQFGLGPGIHEHQSGFCVFNGLIYIGNGIARHKTTEWHAVFRLQHFYFRFFTRFHADDISGAFCAS